MELPQRRPLDNDYVGEIVGQRVTSFSLSAGSKKCDNVIGKMLSLEVETMKEDGGEGETLNLVIKSLLPLTGDINPGMVQESQMFNQLKVFPAELTFYKEVRSLLQNVTGYSCKLPKFYSGVTDGFNDYLAMDDLRAKGYNMADKKVDLTLPEVTKVLQKIAGLHAHSYFVIASGNEKMKELQSSVLSDHVWDYQIFDVEQDVFFNALIQKMAEILRETGDVENGIRTEKFAKIGHKILMALSRRTGEKNYFKTILRDLWTNNVLFKYSEDGEIQALIASFYENLEYGLCYDLVAVPFQLGEPEDNPSNGPPPALPREAILGMAEMLKQGAKRSPVALQRLKELLNEMRKMKSDPNKPPLTLGDDGVKSEFRLSKVSRLDKESKSFFSGKSPKIVIHVFDQSKAAVSTSPFAKEKHSTFFKLSFTQGGIEDFMEKLGDTLRQKNWEKKPPKPELTRRLGILGIERDLKDEAKRTDKQIPEAFQDLKILMEMAKPMVQLANKIAEKAAAKQKQASTASSPGADPEDTAQFWKQLLGLGIEDPVTKDAYSSKDEYHLNLAKEVCTALDNIVLDAGGMMTLVEAYCRLNRARGVHVISPHDLMSACHMLNRVPNAPLSLCEFDSKVRVLQHHSFDDEIVLGHILSLLEETGSITPDEYAKIIGIPLFVSKQSLLMAEARSKLCRDDSIEGLRFYPNIFLDAEITA